MTTPLKPSPQSLFPDLPRDMSIDKKSGMLNFDLQNGLSALFQAAQKNFSNEGVRFPPLTPDQQSQILAIYTALIGSPLPLNTPDISGATIFDSVNRIPKQFIIQYDNSTPPLIVSAQWAIINVMLTYSGNPNTHVAGMLNWFCFDTTNRVLYICTASGDAASAVWTSV
jgi:hypothetical protein